MKTASLKIIAFLLAASVRPQVADGQSGYLDPEAVRILESGEPLTVCVCLADTSLRDDPMIVRAEAFREAREAFRKTPTGSVSRIRSEFRYSPTLLLELQKSDELQALAGTPGVVSVSTVPMGSGGLVESRELIRANQVFEQGITGAGRVAAVLDSGVATAHPDIAPALLHQHHILGNMSDLGEGAEDGHGHGTNVCGIIVSRGTIAPRGVAPGASLIAIKVLDNFNRGFISDWTAGVEYVVGLHEAGTFKVDAINMSLVSDATFPLDCDSSYPAFSNACTAATEAGIAVFASSGNTGHVNKLTSPACLSNVISVGSTPDTLPNRVSTFTSRSSGLDLLAPGDAITSTGISGGTSTFVGTSQACPHAVALACLLREVMPALSVDLMLSVLQATGVEVSDPASGLAFRRIDAEAAVAKVSGPEDCNANGFPDGIDIDITGTSLDLNANQIPDECEQHLEFIRGDINGSSVVDLSDAVKTFLYLFSGHTITCVDAGDSNDSGKVDISDGVYTLLYLFQGGKEIPLPGPSACGSDPTLDGLSCEAFAPCGA